MRQNRSNLYLGYYEYMVNTMVASVTRPQLVVLFMQNKCVFVFKDDWSVLKVITNANMILYVIKRFSRKRVECREWCMVQLRYVREARIIRDVWQQFNGTRIKYREICRLCNRNVGKHGSYRMIKKQQNMAQTEWLKTKYPLTTMLHQTLLQELLSL